MTGEVIFEFQVMPHAVKVSAIDVDTGTEVAIMGPRSASHAELEETARAKLEWVLKKGSLAPR
jgi:predicted metal-dependent hydrolase